MKKTLLAAALAAVLSPASAALQAPEILVLSNRADLVSGGDALVEIKWPAGAAAAMAKISLNGAPLNGVFAQRADGRYLGLVTGLRQGANVLAARVPGAGAEITLQNHPIGGPVFSGAQLQPWTCSTTSSPSLGQPLDAQCNAPAAYRYMYRTTTGQFSAYDPTGPVPANMTTASTDTGATVPYIVRIERGTLNRGIHEIAVLADPARPWSPWTPADQPGWNHKVVMQFGAGTGQTYRQGTPESVLNHEALSRGFAVVSSSMMVNSQHANFVTVAETVMMLKEHLAERYGAIRYTIGQGGSGGALLQYLVAENYPGLVDGLRPTQDWEDSISGAYREFADSAAVTAAFTSSPLTYSNEERAAIGGWGLANVNVFNIENGRVGDYMRPDDGTQCAGTASYHPQTNPAGTRCTFQDFMSSVLGLRPDGKANPVFDNVGVQYGLQGLLEGRITPEKFVDVNLRAGGFDIDGRWQPQRSEISGEMAALLHRTGQVTYGKQLGNVPILAIRGTNNNDYHYPFRTVVKRARLAAANGHAGNHVYWITPVQGMSTLARMDEWLSNLQADTSGAPLAQRVVASRPADLVSGCGVSGTFVTDLAACDATYPYFREPRTVAGDATTVYTMKCQLKPLDRRDYAGVVFTDDQWAALQSTFPSGVCDFSKPGIGFQENVPWLTYAAGAGGQPLPAPPRSTALR
ncbi:DUF6351 family protein [Aquincola sp. MAHUQ-54]|uniref:DUF6351 family protein n=1 Tax=Aquincola agrisoli TaxID=3119538 RepID=A0AAW9Q3S2_9BURK